jgi:capsular polysaccharide biosynthesis protein
MEMADAMAESYVLEMTAILNNDSVKVLDNAYSSYLSHDASREAWKDRIKFALIGFAIAVVIVVITEIFDRKVRTVREATIRDSIPVIGIIPDYMDKKR